MERLALARRGAFGVGLAMSAIVAVAVFALDAPAWILVPLGWTGATLHMQMRQRALRKIDQR